MDCGFEWWSNEFLIVAKIVEWFRDPSWQFLAFELCLPHRRRVHFRQWQGEKKVGKSNQFSEQLRAFLQSISSSAVAGYE